MRPGSSKSTVTAFYTLPVGQFFEGNHGKEWESGHFRAALTIVESALELAAGVGLRKKNISPFYPTPRRRILDGFLRNEYYGPIGPDLVPLSEDDRIMECGNISALAILIP